MFKSPHSDVKCIFKDCPNEATGEMVMNLDGPLPNGDVVVCGPKTVPICSVHEKTTELSIEYSLNEPPVIHEIGIHTTSPVGGPPLGFAPLRR